MKARTVAARPAQYHSSAGLIAGTCAGTGERDARLPRYVSTATAAPPLTSASIFRPSIESVIRPLYVSVRCHSEAGGVWGGSDIAVRRLRCSLDVVFVNLAGELSKSHKTLYAARFRSLIKAKSDPAKCILYAPALVAAAVPTENPRNTRSVCFFAMVSGVTRCSERRGCPAVGLGPRRVDAQRASPPAEAAGAESSVSAPRHGHGPSPI
jgi:hypothetical protein